MNLPADSIIARERRQFGPDPEAGTFGLGSNPRSALSCRCLRARLALVPRQPDQLLGSYDDSKGPRLGLRVSWLLPEPTKGYWFWNEESK